MGQFSLVKAAKDEYVLVSQLTESLEGIYRRLGHAMRIDRVC